jgi:SAM-dependent methyltransferase
MTLLIGLLLSQVLMSSIFEIRFGADLGNTKRWAAFKFIADELYALRRPVGIVETGCLRLVGNWAGDGQSTAVWDWLLARLGGYGHSYDISAESVAAARSAVRLMQVHQQDSVEALTGFASASTIDLLYLDSFDWSADSTASAEHHLKELQAIYDRLRPGCLIAIDDCFSDLQGKHTLAKDWLASLGIQPVTKGYITVWRKPLATA